MEWTELCDNPDAILAYYRSPPSLERFELLEAAIMSYSPSIHLAGVLPVPPDKYIVKGDERRPDAVELVLGFWELTFLSIEGITTDSVGTLLIARHNGNEVAFDFQSESMVCRGAARHLTIDNISPRKSKPETAAGPKLFSHPNVWNSCLLFAKTKGFAISFACPPNAAEAVPRGRWLAIKEGGVRLTAENPIELAGLIALYEHIHPTTNEPYWWRMEGPDLLTELLKKNAEHFFGPGL